MKFKDLKLFVVLLVTFFISSCSNESIESNEKNYSLIDSNFINQTQALDILSKISFSKDSNSHYKGGDFIKKIKDFKSIKDKNNKEEFYITNYEKGGFIILAADSRLTPVLAFSDENNFSIDDKNNVGLSEWINLTKKSIEHIRKSDNTLTVNKKWNKYINSKTIYTHYEFQENLNSNQAKKPIGDGDDCLYRPVETVIVDKRTVTKWGQGYPFNTYMPTIQQGCGTSENMGRALAGCVPIAIAQVMKYHGYPATYDWESMDNTMGGNVSEVIGEIHNYIQRTETIYYECSSTGVPSSYRTDELFKAFGYSSATKSAFSTSSISSSLASSGPVILRARQSDSRDGHMWVCDGMMTNTEYTANCGRQSIIYLHMNWGWNGTNNGWYQNNTFLGYTTDLEMIINIKP